MGSERASTAAAKTGSRSSLKSSRDSESMNLCGKRIGGWGGKRERKRGLERDTDRQTDRHTDRQTDRQRRETGGGGGERDERCMTLVRHQERAG